MRAAGVPSRGAAGRVDLADVAATERVFATDPLVGLVTRSVGGADQQVVAEFLCEVRAVLVPLDFTTQVRKLAGQSADCRSAGRHIAALAGMRLKTWAQCLVVVGRCTGLHTECSRGTDRVPRDFAAVQVECLTDFGATGRLPASGGIVGQEAASSGEGSTDRLWRWAGGFCQAGTLLIPVPEGFIATEWVDEGADSVTAQSVVAAGGVVVFVETAARVSVAAIRAFVERDECTIIIPGHGAAGRINAADVVATVDITAALLHIRCFIVGAENLSAFPGSNRSTVGVSRTGVCCVERAGLVPGDQAAEGVELTDQAAAVEVLATRG